MTPTHATKKVKRYCYYVSAPLLAGEGLRVSAGDIEALVLDRLRALLSSRTDVSETLAPLDLDAYALDAALRKALKLSERWLAMPPVELKSLVQEIVDRITVAADRMEIRLSRVNVAAALEAGGRSHRPDLDPVVLSIEAKLRRAGKGKRLVIENGAEAEVNAGLVEMIKEAFAIRNQLLSGSQIVHRHPILEVTVESVRLLYQHHADGRMCLEVGDHLAEGDAAGLLGGFNIDIFLRHREAVRRRVALQQLQLRRDREAFLLLLLGRDAGIDHRLLAGGVGNRGGIRCLRHVV
jgi:hypothetical protein